jgi:hypothetical protein
MDARAESSKETILDETADPAETAVTESSAVLYQDRALSSTRGWARVPSWRYHL